MRISIHLSSQWTSNKMYSVIHQTVEEGYNTLCQSEQMQFHDYYTNAIFTFVLKINDFKNCDWQIMAIQ